MKSLATRLAEAVSLILHPVFLPLLFGLIAYSGTVNSRYHLFVGLFLAGVPGLATALYLRLIEEPQTFLVKRSSRILPLLSVLLGSILLAVVCGAYLPDYMFPGYLIIQVFLLTFFALLITLYWKISLHLIGWGAAWGCFLAARYLLSWDWLNVHDLSAPFLVSDAMLAILAGSTLLVAWARFYLGSHNLAQLLGGLALGLVVPLCLFYIVAHT